MSPGRLDSLVHIVVTQRSAYGVSAALLFAYRYFIATHPEVEAKITAELAARKILASPDHPAPRALEHDDLSELQYLGAAIKVHLRVHSVRDESI